MPRNFGTVVDRFTGTGRPRRHGTVTYPPIGPPPSAVTKNVAYMKWGGGELPTANTQSFEVLFLGQGGVGAAPATPPACFYTSPQVTVPGTGWDYAVGYDQANAGGWMLRDATTNALLTIGTGQYFLDPGNQAARVAFADSVLARCSQWNAEGIFHDDVQGWWAGLQGAMGSATPKSTTTGTAYTQASWQAAVAGWCQYVGGRLKANGKICAYNAVKYISTGGGTAENNGDQVKELWSAIGNAGTHLCCEFWVFTPQGGRRRVGGEWFNQWDGWQSLAAFAHSLGTGFMTVHDTTALSDAIYSRASAMIDYVPGDLFVRTTGLTNPWDASFAKDLGLPSAAKYRVGNEWRRDFAGGTVRVDPVAGTATLPT